jgi:hypothetical protein
MVATRKDRTQRPRLIADYDRPVDVLVITLGKRMPMEGAGRPGGIELDYSLSTGKPCAIKVIGFRRHDWPKHLDRLTGVIADHLDVSMDVVKNVILGATADPIP